MRHKTRNLSASLSIVAGLAAASLFGAAPAQAQGIPTNSDGISCSFQLIIDRGTGIPEGLARARYEFCRAGFL